MRILLMRVLPAIVTMLTLMGAFCVPALALERTPPGSYLTHRVTTVGELRSQVAKNAVVRNRYSNHFGVSPQELDKYFGDNLTLVALKHPLRAQAWYIDKAGKTSVKSKLLPRGTMVFAAKTGEPLLSWSCGNPLRAQLPAKVAMKPLLQVKTTPPVETKVLPNPPEIISTAVVTAPPVTEITSILPIESPPVLASAVAPAVSMPPVILASGGGGGGGILGLLGGLGALAGLGGGGGGGSNVVVIPEPSSLAAMTSCLLMMPIALGFRRRRR